MKKNHNQIVLHFQKTQSIQTSLTMRQKEEEQRSQRQHFAEMLIPKIGQYQKRMNYVKREL
ncbi:hypothetical protein PFMC_06062 [Plasmodium falciparum CAMP/Malaysia]|uniref:Uncharacterized protein n=1 Tax=Plasmodium falciparum (isolate Camp / Malaysia) TaxID=5835 RepID=A0A024WZ23_PLAFC|nr:hypothetical protein PFMC_06062 [Plasmodium falciparum CAMP/Malaysia]